MHNLKNDIENILLDLNHNKPTEQSEKISDEELIKSALTGIISDSEWLDSAINVKINKDTNKFTEKPKADTDKTLIYQKNKISKTDTNDSTLIMPKKRRK